ncbi:MAG: hypothetical protein KJ709_02655 [Nanoarchaeota archaeon]|nr:hypothetical protein [Nanoarchaeota archaeon]
MTDRIYHTLDIGLYATREEEEPDTGGMTPEQQHDRTIDELILSQRFIEGKAARDSVDAKRIARHIRKSGRILEVPTIDYLRRLDKGRT